MAGVVMKYQFDRTNQQLANALKVIPTGSQTFSKSYYSLPRGSAPLFLDRGHGSHVWDIDDNEYVDLVNGLLCISLGYNDKDVNEAILRQMKKGISFSLATTLELELAKKLTEIIPSAEMVRFGKNGSDVTSAAVRLARAYTGYDHVAVCGYHGWHDWYISSTVRNLGIPNNVSEFTHRFEYNNLDSLEQLFGHYKLAAVVLEPMGAVNPDRGYLEGVRDLCNSYGAVLVFDEMITGFRVNLGGAQKELGVTPDLTTLGKGMANGMPLSAIVGKEDIMMLMDEIFFSGTFGGETLSLAAGNAVIDKMKKEPVIEHANSMGGRLQSVISNYLVESGIEWISFIGHNSWRLLKIDHPQEVSIKTALLEQLFQRGILTLGVNSINYAFSETDLKHVANGYVEAIDVVTKALRAGSLNSLISGQLIEPIFKVRS